MSGVNKVILVGRLGKDPEVRHLESGISVANFSLATSEVYKDKNTGGKKEQTEWHRIVLWRRLAEIAESYLKKGSLVYIEGKLRTRSWEKEGVTRYTTEVEGDTMTMLGSAREDESYNNTNSMPDENAQAAADTNTNSSDEGTDDLPF